MDLSKQGNEENFGEIEGGNICEQNILYNILNLKKQKRWVFLWRSGVKVRIKMGSDYGSKMGDFLKT